MLAIKHGSYFTVSQVPPTTPQNDICGSCWIEPLTSMFMPEISFHERTSRKSPRAFGLTWNTKVLVLFAGRICQVQTSLTDVCL